MVGECRHEAGVMCLSVVDPPCLAMINFVRPL
jgi:hypothetical protein